MQKNLIMAIVLSVVVLLLYNIFFASRKPVVSPPTEEATQSSPWVRETPQQGEILPSSQLERGEEVILENEYVKVVLTSRGGIVKLQSGIKSFLTGRRKNKSIRGEL